MVIGGLKGRLIQHCVFRTNVPGLHILVCYKLTESNKTYSRHDEGRTLMKASYFSMVAKQFDIRNIKNVFFV